MTMNQVIRIIIGNLEPELVFREGHAECDAGEERDERENREDHP